MGWMETPARDSQRLAPPALTEKGGMSVRNKSPMTAKSHRYTGAYMTRLGIRAKTTMTTRPTRAYTACLRK
jgi:hypothetical protein